MNTEKLLGLILEGRTLLMAEFRNARLQTSDIVDAGSGEKIQKHEIVYAVECGLYIGSVLIYRTLPPEIDPSQVKIDLIKGRRYVFELDRFSRKATGLYAHLSYREPQLLDLIAEEVPPTPRP